MAARSTKPNARVIARAVRISTGLILLLFVSSHLLNASFGMISIGAMDAARPFLTGVWSFPPLGLALFLSLILHFFLGLWSIFERPTLKTNAQDIVQIVTAVLVLPVMASHVIGVSMLQNAGMHVSYEMAIRTMWIANPTAGLLQILVVTIVWLHGCAGLLIWLRSMERARNIVLWVYPIAIAIPVLALLGFSEAGRDVLNSAAAPVQQAAESDLQTPAPQIDFGLIVAVTNWVIWGSLALAAVTLLARALRFRLATNLKFSANRDGRSLAPQSSGLSLLDAFQVQNVPHASLCQGRGRCGTCAVRIVQTDFPLPEPSELERRTLLRKGLNSGERLACQLKPESGHVSVFSVFPADYTFHALDEDTEGTAGEASA